MAHNKIRPVILAGGKGTRLWPASTPSHPKQFLRLFADHSLFQATVLRVAKSDLFSSPVIVAAKDHKDLVLKQLEELDISTFHLIMEPQAKDTATAIALAANAIHLPHSGDEYLAILPCDHWIEDPASFHSTLAQAREACESNQRLFLFGIKPDHPNTNFGYLFPQVAEEKANKARSIKAFKEKPDMQTAEHFLQQGDCYWNSGIFLFPSGLFLNELEIHAPDIAKACEAAIDHAYMEKNCLLPAMDYVNECSSMSIDYALMEKTDKAAFLPLETGWSDLGTWQSVWEKAPKEQQDNAIKGAASINQSENCFAYSDGPEIVLSHMQNCVAIASNGSILVSSLEHAAEIKQLATRKAEQSNAFTKSVSSDGVVTVAPNHLFRLQPCGQKDREWVLLSGSLQEQCGTNRRNLKAGDHLALKAGQNVEILLENIGLAPCQIAEISR